jgi:hypothetical protein
MNGFNSNRGLWRGSSGDCERPQPCKRLWCSVQVFEDAVLGGCKYFAERVINEIETGAGEEVTAAS